MNRKKITATFWLILISNSLLAQFPPLEISAEDVISAPNSVVEVSIRAGTNWQNITSIAGTIVFDPALLDQPQTVFWGLTNPQGAVFTDMGGGIFIYDWNSLIAIGPTLNPDDVVFTIQFNVIGSSGNVSPIAFGSSPEPLYWENGFGWSGNNYAITNGSVSISGPDNDLIFRDGFESAATIQKIAVVTY